MNIVQKFFEKQGAEYGFNIIMAVIILIVGYFLIKIFVGLLRKGLLKTKLDGTVIGFIKSTVKVTLYIILGIIIASVLKVPTAPLVTVFGAAGLAVSLALKDSLANMASGLIILLTKQFSLNDYVEIDNMSGTVKKIGLIYTTLNTPDNKRIFIPNGQITTTKMINYSAEENRRLDLVFSIDYHENVRKVKEVLHRVILNSSYTLQKPDPIIRVLAHHADGIQIDVKVWVKSENYWDLYYDLMEDVKLAFDQGHIAPAHKIMDISVVNQDKA